MIISPSARFLPQFLFFSETYPHHCVSISLSAVYLGSIEPHSFIINLTIELLTMQYSNKHE